MPELLENATLGLLGLFCRGRVEPVTTRVLDVDSSSKEDLLVDWLAEVIAAIGTHGELYDVVEVTQAGEHFAKGVLRGEKVDPARHDLRFDVKAATYHGLSIEETAGVLRGRVIFDL
jgi:SHS2 domain-containing protein